MKNESERSPLETFLAMRMREEIAAGNIRITKNNVGFVISHGGQEVEYSDENNQEFFNNLEKAAQTFGRTTTQKEE